jgi:hypothetical protein
MNRRNALKLFGLGIGSVAAAFKLEGYTYASS